MSGRYIIVRGGRVLDPVLHLDRKLDVLIRGGRVAALLEPGRAAAVHKEIDASGCWIVPGLIDLHVHLRQPGDEAAEDIASGTRAAAAGGFTTLVCQPNTRPVLDESRLLRHLCGTIASKARVKVLPAAALSLGLSGRRLSDFESLVLAGARAISDDGVGTRREALLQRALRRAARLGLVVMLHCEERRSSGVMHEGQVARRLGLPGIPSSCESEAVKRALRALERAPARMHLQHISCRESLEMIARAKRRGLPVTCEATPHHVFLTDRDVAASAGSEGPNPSFKVNPPLRSERDRDALRRALQDGTVDAIASDHAPHPAAAKAKGFLLAPFGLIGLETTFGLVLRLVREGVLPLLRAVELLSSGPARVLGLCGGSLRPGLPADLTVVNPRARWVVESWALHSRSHNTPYSGWTLPGRVRYTLVDGRVVWREES